MNLHPISDLERDACLAEDVLTDAVAAWAEAREVVLTPRTLDRLVLVKGRLDACADTLTQVRMEMHGLLTRALREAS